MKLSFLGAAKTVTGSCYLLESGQHKLLIDCGLFQGDDVYERNYEDFEFDPHEIDLVILTHAHMDHSGLLPKLVRGGFTGRIYLTPPTAQLSEILLLDAAKIQEANFSGDNASGKPLAMIYSTFDSLNTIAKFTSVDFGETVDLFDNAKFKFIKAGHILGAASVVLELAGKKLVFSGDLGRRDEAIIESFPLAGNNKLDPDYVIMESLYGGVTHQTRKQAAEELIAIVTETINGGGNVVIPSFAVHKTQEVLEIFDNAFNEGLLDPSIQVVLDSPLAINATRIYEENTGYFNPVKYNLTDKKNLRNLFNFPNLKVTRTHKQSLKRGNRKNSVYIAGSGMAEGGRIIRHLLTHLPNGRNTVVFVGYQAKGTRGREILEGAKEIELDQKLIPVNAKIERIEGFSSHADNGDLLAWVENFDKSKLKKVFLTHADPERSEVFGEEISTKGFHPYIPGWKETIELG